MKTLRLPLMCDISNIYCIGYYSINNESVELTVNDIKRLLNK